MSLSSRLEQVEKTFAQSPRGFGKTIVFTPKSTKIPQSIIAIPSEALSGVLSADKKFTQDERDFMSVETLAPPKRGDTVEYNGEKWYVQEIGNDTETMYDLFCVANRKATNLVKQQR